MTAFLLALLLTILVVPATFADHSHDHGKLDGYLGSFQNDYNGSTGKILALAEAIPADKYSWSPTEEIRSVSEVFMHVTMANYFLASALGKPMPEEVQALGREAEAKVTKKEDVIAMLKKSIAHVLDAAAHTKKGALEEQVEIFGQTRSKQDVFLIIAGHAHEHLGQSIAYARMAGVVPPWSQSGGE